MIEIRDITISADRQSVYLWVDPCYRKTAKIAGLGTRLIERLPNLRYHLCENFAGRMFVDELIDTETAHAFEHVLIELLGELDPKIEIIRAFTKWNWADYGRDVYVVEVFYLNISKFKKALKATNDLFRNLCP